MFLGLRTVIDIAPRTMELWPQGGPGVQGDSEEVLRSR